MKYGDRVVALVDGQEVELVFIAKGDKTGLLYLAHPNSSKIIAVREDQVRAVDSGLTEPLEKGEPLYEIPDESGDNLRLDEGAEVEE